MARKRADRRTGGVFPENERPADERYAAREARPWTPAQEAVLVAAVCVCRSSHAFALTAPWLLRAVGHAPVYPPTRRPTDRQHQETCVRAVELKLCTKMLGGYGGWEPPGVMGFQSGFMGRSVPLTWGERAKVVRPWWKRRRESKFHLSIDHLSDMLGRTDREPLESYLTFLDVNDKRRDPEITGARPPVTAENADQVLTALHELDFLGADWVETRRGAEACLWNLMTGS